MNTTQTKIVDNFRGALTLYNNGDMNSGRSLIQICSGQNPFVKPGQLTWAESSSQIDPGGSVITDLIMDGKERVESGVLYVYAIGHTGRVYKIQVNDPTTFNPDYDNPVLLTTISINSPTFTRGGFIDFYGATERIYIGHDQGVTRIDFAGTNEAFVGSQGSYTQNVPRPLKQFVGKLYVGNGSNIAEIDTTATVTTYTKLSPGFPTGTQVRDLDVTSQGTYLDIVVSRLALFSVTSTTQQTVSTANSESYIFEWNGTDTGYTSYSTFPSFSLNANIMFQNHQFTFGVDQYGMAVYNPTEKMLTIPEIPYVSPNAISSTGNLLNFMNPLYYLGVLEADMYCWGSLDFEVGNPLGFWDLFFLNATSPETDILQVPWQLPISNTGFGASSNGYTDNLFGTSKIYFSTIESSSAPSTAYRLYKWRPIVSINQTPSTDTLIDAVYQTQTQLFSEKVMVSEVRVYGEPWVANNSFLIDLIGSDGNPISGSSYTFTAGSTLTVGNDYAWYNCSSAPTYAIGLRIMNKGTANHVINKVEIDYSKAGK